MISAKNGKQQRPRRFDGGAFFFRSQVDVGVEVDEARGGRRGAGLFRRVEQVQVFVRNPDFGGLRESRGNCRRESPPAPLHALAGGGGGEDVREAFGATAGPFRLFFSAAPFGKGPRPPRSFQFPVRLF